MTKDKKTIFLWVLLILLIIVGAVIVWKLRDSSPTILTQNESAITAQTTTNPKELKIAFNANPTTGYMWFYEINDALVLDLTENYEISADCAENTTGCGGVTTFTLKGLNPGSATATFKYSRGWETEVEPVFTEIYEVTVDDQLNVTATHTGNYNANAALPVGESTVDTEPVTMPVEDLMMNENMIMETVPVETNVQ